MNLLKKYIILLLLFSISNVLVSQNQIDKGFEMLEKGQFSQAEEFFELYLKQNPDNKTAKLCYGRAVGLNGNPEKALTIFNDLLDKAPNNIEYQINKAESLLWLKRFKDGLKQYKAIDDIDNKNPIVKMGIANSYSSLNQYKNAIRYYKKSLELDDSILGTKIGLAYTYHANNENGKALKVIREILDVNPDQDNIKALKTKIEQSYKREISQDVRFTFDSGDNRNIHSKTQLKFPINIKHEVYLSYQYSNFNNTISKFEANQNIIGLGYKYDVTNTIKAVSNLNYLISNSNTPYSDLTFKFGLETKPGFNQNLNIYLAKEYHNFNVDLINLDIAQYHGIINYHWFTKSRVGLYGQYIYTQQTDDNSRNLGFISLYYLFKTKQVFKVGLNGNYIGFKEAKPLQYFSPESYTLGEVFAETKLSNTNKKLEFITTGAFGVQSFDSNANQSTYRVEASITYKPNKSFSAKLYGSHSNIAASNAAGFEFSSVGLTLLYRF